MTINKVTIQLGHGLTLSLAQLHDGWLTDQPNLAIVDKNGELITDYYDNHKKQLTNGDEVIENASGQELITLLRQVQFQGPPPQSYYERRRRLLRFKVAEAKIGIEPIAANAAQIEEATRPK